MGLFWRLGISDRFSHEGIPEILISFCSHFDPSIWYRRLGDKAWVSTKWQVRLEVITWSWESKGLHSSIKHESWVNLLLQLNSKESCLFHLVSREKQTVFQEFLKYWSKWIWDWYWRRQRQPTPVFLLGKSHGPRSLAGYSPWGR